MRCEQIKHNKCKFTGHVTLTLSSEHISQQGAEMSTMPLIRPGSHILNAYQRPCMLIKCEDGSRCVVFIKS